MEDPKLDELTKWHSWWKRRGRVGIRRVLMKEWDPRGVEGVPHLADYYDAYGGVVSELLRDGATAEEIEAYLRNVREHWMGIDTLAHPARERAVAAHLVAWYAESIRSDRRFNTL
jgi:hypothetical protein